MKALVSAAHTILRRFLKNFFRVSVMMFSAGILAVETRMFALQDSLPEMKIDSYSFEPGTSQTDMTFQLTSMFSNCPYRILQLSSALPLQAVLTALDTNRCTNTLVGAVDRNDAIYEAIRDGKVLFTIAQQAHLQGSFPVLMATLFATTGQALAPAGLAQDGNYLSGPVVVNASTLTSDSLQQCQSDAFPICPNTLNALGQTATCACTDRKKIHLAGVTHGVTTDSFWDLVYAAMDQAAFDFDISLQTIRLEPEDIDDVVISKMADHIGELCNSSSIDGLFVSIPSQAIVDALEDCLALKIPIVSINSGAEAAQALGLLEHIGQLEYRAGEGAGQRLIDSGVRYGYCLMHETDNSGLLERCAGMKGAFEASDVDGVQYMGSFDVSTDDLEVYRRTVENAVNTSSVSWDGVGVLLCGQIQVPGILNVKSDHPNLKIGSFDSSPALIDALQNGTILFGIDQNSYLQGYLPVALLTMYAYTKQDLVDLFVESGPDFIEAVPSLEKQECEAVLFVACFDNSTDVHGASSSSNQLSSGAIAGICVACFFALFGLLYVLYRNRVLSRYVTELQQQGLDVRAITISDRLRITYRPVEQVVEDARTDSSEGVVEKNGQPAAASDEDKSDTAT